ncbi:MAG: hypothetical protein AB7U34_06275 [Novosphingobium sp.]
MTSAAADVATAVALRADIFMTVLSVKYQDEVAISASHLAAADTV